MIDANSLRQGVVFEQNGSTFQVVEFRRHKTARAKGIVMLRLKMLQRVIPKNFHLKVAKVFRKVQQLRCHSSLYIMINVRAS